VKFRDWNPTWIPEVPAAIESRFVRGPVVVATEPSARLPWWESPGRHSRLSTSGGASRGVSVGLLLEEVLKVPCCEAMHRPHVPFQALTANHKAGGLNSSFLPTVPLRKVHKRIPIGNARKLCVEFLMWGGGLNLLVKVLYEPVTPSS